VSVASTRFLSFSPICFNFTCHRHCSKRLGSDVAKKIFVDCYKDEWCSIGHAWNKCAFRALVHARGGRKSIGVVNHEEKAIAILVPICIPFTTTLSCTRSLACLISIDIAFINVLTVDNITSCTIIYIDIITSSVFITITSCTIITIIIYIDIITSSVFITITCCAIITNIIICIDIFTSTVSINITNCTTITNIII